MSDENVTVEIEETDKVADGKAECTIGTDALTIHIRGEEAHVCRAIEALFAAMPDVLFEGVTEEAMRDLVAKMNTVTDGLKDGPRYHMSATLKTDSIGD